MLQNLLICVSFAEFGISLTKQISITNSWTNILFVQPRQPTNPFAYLFVNSS